MVFLRCESWTSPLLQRSKLHIGCRWARKVGFNSRASSKRSSEEVEVEKLETLPKAQEIECLGGSRNVKCWIILWLYWMIWLYDTNILWLYYDILWLYCYLELSHLDLFGWYWMMWLHYIWKNCWEGWLLSEDMEPLRVVDVHLYRISLGSVGQVKN